jgi:hypothetical protein
LTTFGFFLELLLDYLYFLCTRVIDIFTLG